MCLLEFGGNPVVVLKAINSRMFIFTLPFHHHPFSCHFCHKGLPLPPVSTDIKFWILRSYSRKH